MNFLLPIEHEKRSEKKNGLERNESPQKQGGVSQLDIASVEQGSLFAPQKNERQKNDDENKSEKNDVNVNFIDAEVRSTGEKNQSDIKCDNSLGEKDFDDSLDELFADVLKTSIVEDIDQSKPELTQHGLQNIDQNSQIKEHDIKNASKNVSNKDKQISKHLKTKNEKKSESDENETTPKKIVQENSPKNIKRDSKKRRQKINEKISKNIDQKPGTSKSLMRNIPKQNCSKLTENLNNKNRKVFTLQNKKKKYYEENKN